MDAKANVVLDLLFPRICACCGEGQARSERHLCWDCFGSVDRCRGVVCACCGEHPEGLADAPFVCGNCRMAPPAFDAARSAGRFGGVLRELLHAFKYNRALWLREDLVDLLEGCVIGYFDRESIDAVTAVPLHFSRRRRRTYNQAEVLARGLASRLDKPYVQVVQRVRDTPTQTNLSASARRENMKNAFDALAEDWITGRGWLLVDDVMTTGATLRECARILRRCGATGIRAATVARG